MLASVERSRLPHADRLLAEVDRLLNLPPAPRPEPEPRGNTVIERWPDADHPALEPARRAQHARTLFGKTKPAPMPPEPVVPAVWAEAWRSVPDDVKAQFIGAVAEYRAQRGALDTLRRAAGANEKPVYLSDLVRSAKLAASLGYSDELPPPVAAALDMAAAWEAVRVALYAHLRGRAEVFVQHLAEAKAAAREAQRVVQEAHQAAQHAMRLSAAPDGLCVHALEQTAPLWAEGGD
jgi:hypothetical protein